MASTKSLNNILCKYFSTSTVGKQLVKPPLQVYGLEGRYAMALYSAAYKQKQLELVEKDFEKLNKIGKSDKVFSNFINNPIIAKSLKASAIKDISAKLSLSSCSSNLLLLLAENGRLKKLSNIIHSFNIVTSAAKNDLPIAVTISKALDNSVKEELEAVLKKFAKKGEKLLISYKVDPAIVGGMVVSIGDKYVDMSTASKLKKYSDILKSGVGV